MKQIIFALAFIYCVFCAPRAYNVEERDEGSCMSGDYSNADSSMSTSTCVDRDLYTEEGYFEKCCYIRFRKEGVMKHGCIGLTMEHYMDIPETIEIMESGKNNIFSDFKDTKIYELNCNSSYLKLFALSFALISLLF